MKRIITAVILVTVSLLQQGCYVFADRDGQYFRSMDEVFDHSQSGTLFDTPKTIGQGLVMVGIFIPVAGWVTLVPGGFLVGLAEGLVVAPAVDIALMPVDYSIRQVHESRYQNLARRLDTDFDGTLADASYWSVRTDEKLKDLNRWLSQRNKQNGFTADQVAAILSLFKYQVKYRKERREATMWWPTDLDNLDRMMEDNFGDIVDNLYSKTYDEKSTSVFVNWLVEAKLSGVVDMRMLCPEPIRFSFRDDGRFSDEQLRTLLGAGIEKHEIERILERRQEKRDTESGQATDQKL